MTANTFTPAIPEDIINKLSVKGWEHRSAGVYESQHSLRTYDKDFFLFIRRSPIDGFVKKPSDRKPANPCYDSAGDRDPNLPMGDHKGELGPQKKVVPEQSFGITTSFERFQSLQSIRTGSPSIVIGYDTEYFGSPRQILSWQFAIINNGMVIEYIFLRRGPRLLSFEIALARILDDIGITPIDARKDTDEKDVAPRTKVTVVCHAGLADWTALDQSGKYRTNLLRYCHQVQGGVITLQPIQIKPKSVNPKYGRNSKRFPVLLTVADTMCHAPAKERTLGSLGEVVGCPKVSLPTEPVEYISHMDQLLKDDPQLYFEYAGRDSVVTLLYLSSLYGENRTTSATITGAGARLMKGIMMDYFDANNNEQFNRVYRGLHTVSHGKVPVGEGVAYCENTSLEPISDKAGAVQRFASLAFVGGYNSCSSVGYYPEETYDYDLQNAYPTAMCLVPDIDWEHPVKYEIKNEVLTLQKWHIKGGVYNALMPFIAYVRFRFPESVDYPCIPIRVDGIPIFPRSSDGVDGVYACGPELYLALQLGAEIWCETGYVLNTRITEAGESYSLRESVYRLVRDRAAAKELCGKGSLEDLILKTMVNAGYGKTAQNVIEKSAWSAYKNEMETLGCSPITNPVSACMITSIVRAVLLAAQNQATGLGYETYSVTTDGFIASIPQDTLYRLDLYGLGAWMERARLYLTDGEDPALWEIKHVQDDLVNFTTRGNVSLHDQKENPYIHKGKEYAGVCAHNSVKSGFQPDSYEDRLWLMTAVLSRTGPVVYTDKVWTGFKQVILGTDFSVSEKERRIHMDFDMKRKPVRESISAVHPVIEGVRYEIANLSTQPYATVAEYRLYRRAKDNMSALRTCEDWERFFVRISVGATGAKPRNIEWARLNSCIMGHRAGLWNIPALEHGTVDQKCAWINQHNKSGKKFTKSDWKHAREASRQANMLPRSMFQDLLDELMSVEG